jgi:23S rRNA (cytosine1962-C5)-methyltransferase
MEVSGKIVLKKGKEFSIERFHPWIFSGAIQKKEGDTNDGSWVEVTDYKGGILGYGHYQNGSISVRLLTFEKARPSENFWQQRFQKALTTRKHSGLPSSNTNAFRLVHAEGDGLPGLIVDYYNGVAVVQAHSIGMHKDRLHIASALKMVLAGDLTAIYYKSHGTLPGQQSEEELEGYLEGMVAVPHVITENSNKFLIDWEEGQKTGFFLDQRDNRKLLGDFSNGKRILNTFCYTGGFSVYALKAEAAVVHSVDASAKAIELTKKNLELNGYDPNRHMCYAEDTFTFLKGKENVYDVIILDPPAFAKHREARHQAVKGYQRLNTEAMQKIKSGGILFTFSCSQVVDRKLFYDTIVSSAIQAGRIIKVLHHLSQPADHPVSIFHPEGEYLKGLVLYIE